MNQSQNLFQSMAKIYVTSSLLMAALFIVSASVQFDDQVWYAFAWVLLYAFAAYVNLASCLKSLPLRWVRETSKVTSIMAQVLVCQVMFDPNFHGRAGLWSLDMREKLVREKLGCVLVNLSMILQGYAVELFQREPSKRIRMEVSPSIEIGMAVLVGIGYGLSGVFLKYHQQDMKF